MNIFYYLIAFLIATEGIFVGHKIVGIDIFRILEVFLFLFLLKKIYFDLQDKQQIIGLYTKFFLGFILLLFLKLGVLLFFKDELNTDIFRAIFRLLVMYIYLYLTYYLITKRFNFVKVILWINFPILLIAFLQFHFFSTSDFFWAIKDNFFSANTVSVMIDDVGTSWQRSRVVGLYSYAITLAYIIVTNLLLVVYLYVKERNIIYFLYFLFLFILSILTMTRSLVISASILLIYMIIISMKTRTNSFHKLLIGLILGITLVYSSTFIVSNSNLFSRIESVQDGSASGRLPLAVTGVYTILHNPLAVSKKDDQEAKEEMYRVFHHPNILIYTSHNGLIQLGFEYTLFGILLFVYFIYILNKRVLSILSRELRLYFIIAIIAYLGNSLFHNAFIFYSDFPIMIIFAILAYEYKKAIQNV